MGKPWLLTDLLGQELEYPALSQTKEKAQRLLDSFFGAGEGTLTPGLVLGKDAL
jgi:hypothetical protein